jgi:hypothetical protein
MFPPDWEIHDPAISRCQPSTRILRKSRRRGPVWRQTLKVLAEAAHPETAATTRHRGLTLSGDKRIVPLSWICSKTRPRSQKRPSNRWDTGDARAIHLRPSLDRRDRGMSALA